MLILILYENARQERLRGQEMEMLTRCILGNNTWGKLGQCAADVDIGWSAGGATISSCHLRGRSAAGVEEGHVEGLLLHTTRLP